MNWSNIFIGDLDIKLILEILLRTLVMFVLVLVFLRLSGKKGVRQLSIFEVAIIIALGSAAGDPMFNGEFAILPSLVVFAVILLLYRLITYLASKYPAFENVVEGDPMYVIEEGRFVVMNETAHTFAKDEFFAELRVQSVEHVGQVRKGILETNGQLSLLFYPDEEVKPGLPIWPKMYAGKSMTIPSEDEYACTNCGNVETLKPGEYVCKRCKRKEWVKSIQTPRLS